MLLFNPLPDFPLIARRAGRRRCEPRMVGSEKRRWRDLAAGIFKMIVEPLFGLGIPAGCGFLIPLGSLDAIGVEPAKALVVHAGEVGHGVTLSRIGGFAIPDQRQGQIGFLAGPAVF